VARWIDEFLHPAVEETAALPYNKVALIFPVGRLRATVGTEVQEASMKVSFGSAIAAVLLVACFASTAKAQYRGAQVHPGVGVAGTFHPYNGNAALFSGGTGINYGNGGYNPMIYNGFNPIDYGNGQANPMIYNNFNPINYGNGQANRSIYNGFNPINYGNGQANRSIYNGFSPINYGSDQLVPRSFTGNTSATGNAQNQVNGTGTRGAGGLNNSLVPQAYTGGYHGSSATRAWRAAQARAAVNAATGNPASGNGVAGNTVIGGAGAATQAQSSAPATGSSMRYARGKTGSRSARNSTNR
jgi:hypothetical protein